VITDRHQRIIRVNDSFIRVYGWNRDDLIGKELYDFIAEEERELSKKRPIVKFHHGSGKWKP